MSAPRHAQNAFDDGRNRVAPVAALLLVTLMRLLSRCTPLLIVALTGSMLRADEIQLLPALTVNAPAGPRSALPEVIARRESAGSGMEFNDLARLTTGLSFNDAGAGGFGLTSSLRGLSNTPFFGDTSAPLYIDGIPFANTFSFPTRIFGASQIEIYRGPQAGTLFGRAGDAGVIQIKSARPGSSAGGMASVSAGNYETAAAGVRAETSGAGKADLSVGVNGYRRDGFIRNTRLNTDVDGRETLAGYVRGHYRPVAGTELSLHLLGERTRNGAQALVPLGGPLYEVDRGREGETDIDFTAGALGLTRKLAEGMLTATTSFSRWEMDPYSNRLVVFGGADFDSALAQAHRAFTQEIRFTADDYSAGLYYSDGQAKGATRREFSGFPIEGSEYVIDSQTAALFGRATWRAGSAFTVTPGLRLERTGKDFARTETIPSSFVIRRDDAWSAFLPSLGLSHRLSESSDVTLNLARGFKPGGYSGYTGRVDLAQFGSQRTWTAELAYSFAPIGGRQSYVARAYASRVRGYQIERSFAVPNSFVDEYLVVNAEEARVLGLELEASWILARDVRLTAAGSVSRATLETFRDPFTGVSYSGNQAPYAPEGNALLRLAYAPARGVFASAGVSWTGTTYYDEQESALFAQRSYTLVDADLGYRFARGEVRLFGRNLLDRAFYSSITPGVAHATPGAPLTWGAEIALTW